MGERLGWPIGAQGRKYSQSHLIECLFDALQTCLRRNLIQNTENKTILLFNKVIWYFDKAFNLLKTALIQILMVQSGKEAGMGHHFVDLPSVDFLRFSFSDLENPKKIKAIYRD